MTKRRQFIKTGVLGAAGIAIGAKGFSAKSYRQIQGANERLTVAVIGIRGQGGTHISSFLGMKDSKNVRLKTLCDADEATFAERVKAVQSRTGETPVTEWDMRKVLEDKEIDAVSFATPNFWHALGTVWACQAGKHVYVEKPLSHNPREAELAIEAALKGIRPTGCDDRFVEDPAAWKAGVQIDCLQQG